MNKEQLRLSLDTALKFRELIDIFRDAVQSELEDNPDKLNDELIVAMLGSFNGLGKVIGPLTDATEIINNRISWLGDGEGFEKKINEIEFGVELPPIRNIEIEDEEEEDGY